MSGPRVSDWPSRMAEFHHTVAGKEVKKKLSSNRKEAKNKNANPDKIVDPLENMSDCEEDNPPCYNQNRKKEEKGIVCMWVCIFQSISLLVSKFCFFTHIFLTSVVKPREELICESWALILYFWKWLILFF